MLSDDPESLEVPSLPFSEVSLLPDMPVKHTTPSNESATTEVSTNLLPPMLGVKQSKDKILSLAQKFTMKLRRQLVLIDELRRMPRTQLPNYDQLTTNSIRPLNCRMNRRIPYLNVNILKVPPSNQ